MVLYYTYSFRLELQEQNRSQKRDNHQTIAKLMRKSSGVRSSSSGSSSSDDFDRYGNNSNQDTLSEVIDTSDMSFSQQLVYWNDRLYNLRQFKNKPDYSEQDVYNQIWDTLTIMCEERYDFFFSDKKHLYLDSPQLKNQQQIKRRGKGHFTCSDPDCIRMNRELGKLQNSQWNSYAATWEFNLYFQSCQKLVTKQECNQMDYPFILKYQFRFYDQKCTKCEKWASFQIPKQSVECVVNIIKSTIQIILDKYQSPVNGFHVIHGGHKNQKKIKKKVVGHVSKFCQACQEGKCEIASKRGDQKGKSDDSDASSDD